MPRIRAKRLKFHAKDDTPSVNGLTQGLLDHNSNHDKNGVILSADAPGSQPELHLRQNHDYTPEQQAFDSGLMDKFPGIHGYACPASTYSDVSALGAGIVMGYYDGNTVTGLWNYAQHSR